MINKYFESKIPEYPGKQNEVDESLENYIKEQRKEVEKNLEEVQFSKALTELWNMISRTNKYIDETTPWILAKEKEKEKLASVMYHLAENLREIAILLKPFMPETTENILKQLGMKDPSLQTWESLFQYNNLPKNITVIEKGKPLFVRLDPEVEIDYIRQGMQGK